MCKVGERSPSIYRLLGVYLFTIDTPIQLSQIPFGLRLITLGVLKDTPIGFVFVTNK